MNQIQIEGNYINDIDFSCFGNINVELEKDVLLLTDNRLAVSKEAFIRNCSNCAFKDDMNLCKNLNCYVKDSDCRIKYLRIY